MTLQKKKSLWEKKALEEKLREDKDAAVQRFNVMVCSMEERKVLEGGVGSFRKKKENLPPKERDAHSQTEHPASPLGHQNQSREGAERTSSPAHRKEALDMERMIRFPQNRMPIVVESFLVMERYAGPVGL